jgi:alkylhydroperoxidase family enzyme
MAARIPLSGEGDTLDESTVAKVRTWGEQDFSNAEKAALHYTERLVVDHANIDGELFDELLQFYSEAQIVELGWAVVSYLGFGRLIHSFGLRPEQQHRAGNSDPSRE